ncbi:MAG TPA: fused MFS/spermidine synthase [Candidatus Saccharimonadales bacterium]|nr:fused MFS/spermidine synthase [Candidatus Saccharimonadales bacterium]
MQKILLYLRSHLGSYELIAFASGFVLMAYEMVASRILAPSIGSSMYVWTSVIGTMIAALAIGYAVGGWLADKRVAAQDVAWLLLLSAIAVGGTLLFYEPILFIISEGVTDQRLQGILAAVLLFLPASFLLGMISPYLARLRVKSVVTTGRSVAMLSALNSIGGISGTFFAGFVFFSLIGSRETLALLVIALVACSWLVMPRHRRTWRMVATFCLALLLVLQFAGRAQAAGLVANIDTPTSHYSVVELGYRGHNTRLLVTDPRGFQSGIRTDGNKDLVFDYTQRLAEAVAQAPKKDRIVILGGGVFTLPEYLAVTYPQSQIDVVEIDPQLEQIAKEYFYYRPQPNIRVFAQDARAFLHDTKDSQYDLVLVDAYNNDSAIPFSLSTREFTEGLKRILTPDGAVLANIIGSASAPCLPALSSLHGSYLSAFAESFVAPVAPRINPDIRQNLIAVYANNSVDWARPLGSELYIHAGAAQKLTDNYAPVESLWQTCH